MRSFEEEALHRRLIITTSSLEDPPSTEWQYRQFGRQLIEHTSIGGLRRRPLSPMILIAIIPLKVQEAAPRLHQLGSGSARAN